MFTIKNSELANNSFGTAVQRLSKLPLPIHGAYTLKRMVDKLNSARKDMSKSFAGIVEKYANKDEKGAVVYKEGGPDVPEEKVEAFLKEQDAFGDVVVTIDRQKLALSFFQLHNVQLSAAELSVLEPLLHDDLEVAPEAATEKTA